MSRLTELDRQAESIEDERAWIRSKLAAIGDTIDPPPRHEDAPPSGADDISMGRQSGDPEAPPTPETNLWGWALAQLPQGPAKGWTPAQLTTAIQRVRPDITGKRVRNMIDRWRSRGKVEYVDGLWRRPATPPKPVQEGAPM